MIDPVTDALVTAGIAKLGSVARGWVAGDPTQRLTAALAGKVEDGQFGLVKFGALEQDPAFRNLISESLRTNQFDEAEAELIIRRHVDDIRGPDETMAFAAEIATLARSLVPQVAAGSAESAAVLAGLAHEDDVHTREVIRDEHEVTRDVLLSALQAARRPVVLDPAWLSGRAGEAWARLLGREPDVAAELRNAVGATPTAESVRAFIESSAHEDADVWEAVIGMADDLGDWSLLERASLRYAGSPGGDRARGLALAAAAAGLGGDTARRDSLLAQGDGVDPASPSVRLVRARIAESPHERLGILEHFEPADDRQRAALEGARAVALFDLGELDAAYAAVARGKVADPDDLVLAEVEATLLIADAQAGKPVTWPQAASAIDSLTRVRSRLLEVRRFEESVQVAGKLAQLHLLVGNYNEVRRLANDLHPDEQGRDATSGIAGALLSVGAPERALELLPEAPTSDEARLTFVAALVEADPARLLKEGIPLLDELIRCDDERIIAEAAWIRVGATLLQPPAPLSADALAALERLDPVRARIFAAAHQEQSDPASADEMLAAGGAHAELLVERGRLAARQDDWAAAQTFFEQAVELAPTPINRLAFADSLRETGDLSSAQSRALEVARRGDHAPNVRNEAYRLAYVLSQQSGDMQEQSEIAREWLAFDAHNEKLAWSYVFTLIRLARYRDAKAVIERTGLEPRNLTDAEIYAEVLVHTTAPELALAELLALSERFGTQSPSIEGRLAMLTLTTDASKVAEDVREKATERLQSYADRFPDAMQRIDIDPADPLREIQPHLEARARAVDAVSTAFTKGEVPVAALAAATGRDVGSTVLAFNILPLGFGSGDLDALELADARSAIGEQVVLESTTLTVAGGLGTELFERIRRSFNRPVVPQAVVDDSRLGAKDATTAQPTMTIGYDLATGHPYIHEHFEDELAREENRATTVLSLLDGLTVVPNVDGDREGPIGKWVREQGHAENIPLHTAEVTLAIAERLQCAVYSDDRVIRVQARRIGFPAFGTPSLLMALRERGMLPSADADAAFRRLLCTRAHGIPLDAFDPVEVSRAAEWGLTSEVAAFLTDRGRWNEELEETLDRWHAFLRACEPETTWPQFWRWVFRVVDAAILALPGNDPRDIIAVVALGATRTEISDEERAYRARLIDALNFARQIYRLNEPVGLLIAAWQQKAAQMQAAATESPEEGTPEESSPPNSDAEPAA